MAQTTKIPELIDPQAMYTTNGQEAWRVLGIMAEFAAATERLRGLRPAVSMFGSARIRQGHPYYEKAETIARLLSDAGFSVISGGGPGLMEAFNRGAHAGRSPAIGPARLRSATSATSFTRAANSASTCPRAQSASKCGRGSSIAWKRCRRTPSPDRRATCR